MAASMPAFPQGPLFLSSLSSFSKAVSTEMGRQPWKALAAASALSVGLSLAVSKVPLIAEKKALLEKVVMDGLRETNMPSASNYGSSFASLSVAPISETVEPSTGAVFPEATPEGKQLAGIGLRKKSVLGLKNITVYAYGLYVDPESLKSSVGSKYESFTPAELSNKEELFEDITESDVGLTVRLVIVYGKLKIGSIRSAFEESVGKGLKKFSGDDNKELLGRFTQIFTDDLMLPKGTTIDLSRLPGQVLQTKIDGKEIGTLQSSLLCQALFDLYIGEDAFDKSAKEGMGQGFASLLSS